MEEKEIGGVIAGVIAVLGSILGVNKWRSRHETKATKIELPPEFIASIQVMGQAMTDIREAQRTRFAQEDAWHESQLANQREIKEGIQELGKDFAGISGYLQAIRG